MNRKKHEVPQRLMSRQFIGPESDFLIFETVLVEPFYLHWHEFYEIEFILEGEWLNIINGVSYPTKKGCFFLLTPADFHKVEPFRDPTLHLINARVSDELISREVREMIYNLGPRPIAVFEGREYDRMVSDLFCLISEHKEKKIGSRRVIKGVLEHILIRFIREVGGAYPARQDEDLEKSKKSIRRSIIYIQNHFRENITLESAAKQCYLSPNYFSERFCQETGSTFQEFLQETRLKFASSLLRSSDVSITEVCYASGFNTLTHFSRVFKKKFGFSPSDYRKFAMNEEQE